MDNTQAIASLQPLNRREVTLGERIYHNLRELLIAGKLVPAERLSLRNVASQLDVSIMPVREAVARLVADGALEVMPNRAVRVPLMTLDKLREITVVRMEIEGFAAERAAVERTDDELERILGYEVEFRRQVERGEDALASNKELHFAIYHAARLPTLVSLIEILWLKVGPVINLDLSSSNRHSTGVAASHHANLVAAIKEGNGWKAKRALTADIHDAAKIIEATGKLPA